MRTNIEHLREHHPNSPQRHGRRRHKAGCIRPNFGLAAGGAYVERVESGFRELSATTHTRSPKSVPDTVSRSREFQVHIHPLARALAPEAACVSQTAPDRSDASMNTPLIRSRTSRLSPAPTCESWWANSILIRPRVCRARRRHNHGPVYAVGGTRRGGAAKPGD
jgi:hypothetical protein